MQFSLAVLGFAAAASAGAVTSIISPAASAPAGCLASHSGQFEITVVNASTVMKRSMEPRQATTCGQTGILTLNLNNGMLKDAAGRVGYIASNYQFQFDGPYPQAGAIYTAGFSLCSNGSLALGGSSVFYECQSGSFYNLYDRHWAAQCTPVFIDIIPCAGSSVTASGVNPSAVATQSADGQPGVATAAPAAVSEFTDGQPQMPTAAPAVSEFTDGQPQVMTSTKIPVSQFTDGQPQVTSTKVPVSQFTDGQPQVTSTAKPVPAGAITVGAGSQAVLALAGVVAAAML